MAINIKELFTLDAHNIHVDKINYNFDQIVANSGGPKGIKGEIGITGNTGQKGEKGEVGAQGLVGSKGEPGTNSDLWYRETKNTSTGDSFHVLKPYGFTSQSSRVSRIILGEQALNDGTSNFDSPVLEGNLGLLHLRLPLQDSVDVASQIILENIEDGDPKQFKIRTLYENGVGTTLDIIGEAPAAGEKTNIRVEANNEITIKALDSSTGKITIGSPSQGSDTRIYSATKNDLYSSGFTKIHSEGGYFQVSAKGFVKLEAVGTNNILFKSNNLNLDAGTFDLDLFSNIRMNTANGDIDLNTTTGNIKLDAPAGTVTLDGDDVSGVHVTLQHAGADKFTVYSEINQSEQTIFFNDPNGDHDGSDSSDVSSGDGIRFKVGGTAIGGPALGSADPGHYAAPNSGTSATPKFRTLSDYFFEDNLVNSVYAQRHIDAADGNLTDKPTGTQFDTLEHGSGGFNNSVVSYVKVGNSVSVNGRFSCRTKNDWSFYDIDTSFHNNYFVLRFDVNFRYLNNGTSPVYVNTAIYTQHGSTLNQAIGPGSSEDIYFGFVGIIYPNSNIIYFYKNGVRTVSGENPIHLIPLSPKDLSVGGSAASDQFLDISFSFTMPTLWNSYNRKYDSGSMAGGGRV